MERILYADIGKHPWNEVYKIATGKTRKKQTLITLKRPDGTITETMEETIGLMLEHLFPEDDPDRHRPAKGS